MKMLVAELDSGLKKLFDKLVNKLQANFKEEEYLEWVRGGKNVSL